MSQFENDIDRKAYEGWAGTRFGSGNSIAAAAFVAGVEHGRETPLQEKKADTEPFNPGDVVQLKSGGSPMTVAGVIAPQGSCPDWLTHVTWIDLTGKPWEQDLPAAALMSDCSKPPVVDEYSARGECGAHTPSGRCTRAAHICDGNHRVDQKYVHTGMD